MTNLISSEVARFLEIVGPEIGPFRQRLKKLKRALLARTFRPGDDPYKVDWQELWRPLKPVMPFAEAIELLDRLSQLVANDGLTQSHYALVALEKECEAVADWDIPRQILDDCNIR